MQVVIQNGELDKFDTKSTSEGFTPLKPSSILKMMPELLNQPHTVVSVYKKRSDLAAINATEETKELMGNIADILGKSALCEVINGRVSHATIDITTSILSFVGVQSVQKVYTLTFEEIGVDPLVIEKIRDQLELYKFEVSAEQIRKLSFEKIVAQKC